MNLFKKPRRSGKSLAAKSEIEFFMSEAKCVYCGELIETGMTYWGRHTWVCPPRTVIRPLTIESFEAFIREAENPKQARKRNRR